MSMTVLEILELLNPWVKGVSTALGVRTKLKADANLDVLIALEKAKLPQYAPRRPVQEEEPDEIKTKIHQIFKNNEGLQEAGIKEYFHLENKNGKRCWDVRIARELEQNVVVADKGSPPFSAQRRSLCNECGQPIEPGDGIYMRTRERGVA